MELCGKNLIVYDFVNFGSLFRHASSRSRDANVNWSKTLV